MKCRGFLGLLQYIRFMHCSIQTHFLNSFFFGFVFLSDHLYISLVYSWRVKGYIYIWLSMIYTDQTLVRTKYGEWLWV